LPDFWAYVPIWRTGRVPGSALRYQFIRRDGLMRRIWFST